MLEATTMLWQDVTENPCPDDAVNSINDESSRNLQIVRNNPKVKSPAEMALLEIAAAKLRALLYSLL